MTQISEPLIEPDDLFLFYFWSCSIRSLVEIKKNQFDNAKCTVVALLKLWCFTIYFLQWQSQNTWNLKFQAGLYSPIYLSVISSKFIQKIAQKCQYFTLIDQSVPLDNFYITFYLRTNQLYSISHFYRISVQSWQILTKLENICWFLANIFIMKWNS